MEKGKVSAHVNYDPDGRLDGSRTWVKEDGGKEQEQAYMRGNPASDHYRLEQVQQLYQDTSHGKRN